MFFMVLFSCGMRGLTSPAASLKLVYPPFPFRPSVEFPDGDGVDREDPALHEYFQTQRALQYP
jgi:hypothetical protein